MKYQIIALLFSIVGSELVWAGDAIINPDTATAQVAPLLAEMGAAANAHDVERHVGFYAHVPWVVFIFNGEPTIGWEAIRDKQRVVWRSGTSDVVYTMQGKPTFIVSCSRPGGHHHFFEITSHNAQWTGG